MSDAATAPIRVGYYVHHHGNGHRARFDKIRLVSSWEIVGLSELDLDGGVRLSSDVPARSRDVTAGGSLHWAPLSSPGPARRAKQLIDWIVQARPVGVVVDVSVETALLCRLAGVATVVVRQHGDRTDTAHLTAYSGAERLLAPFPVELEHPRTPDWVVDKTDHVGFVVAPSVRPGERLDADLPTPDDVVLLWGSGGGTFAHGDLAALAGAAGGRVWSVGSATDVGDTGAVDVGWIDDVAVFLSGRPTVVASAGNNAVADAAGAGCPLVVAPQDRPFDEQVMHAESLERIAVAAIAPIGGSRNDWVAALESARQRRQSLAALAGIGNGAERAAAAIERALLPNGFESLSIE